MAVDLTDGLPAGSYRNAHVGAAARALADEVDVACAAEMVSREIMEEVWPDVDDPAFTEAVQASTLANIEAIFALLAGRGDADAIPESALALAEVSARLEVPIGEIDKAYRVGLTSLWSRWFDAALKHAGEAGIEELISGPTLTIHAYVDRVLDCVVARHCEVRHELHSTRRDQRRRTLTEIIEGQIEVITPELDRMLDYHLADTHLALLIETDEGSSPDAEVAGLRAAADARGTLVVQHGAKSWIAWLCRPTGFDAKQLTRLRRALAETGLTIAVGEPGESIHGMRRSREQALDAARVQRALGAEGHRCLWAREVRLESLLMHDEDRARAFLAEELGRLRAPDPSTARLRETLLAWLATGSHVSAAAMLRVHENTIRNRIRAAEALLGTPLMNRRTELQVALRLERVLNSTVNGTGTAQAA